MHNNDDWAKKLLDDSFRMISFIIIFFKHRLLCCGYWHKPCIFKLWTTCKWFLGSILCLSPWTFVYLVGTIQDLWLPSTSRSHIFRCVFRGNMFVVSSSTGFPFVFTHNLSPNTWEIFHLKSGERNLSCVCMRMLQTWSELENSRPPAIKASLRPFFQRFIY